MLCKKNMQNNYQTFDKNIKCVKIMHGVLFKDMVVYYKNMSHYITYQHCSFDT